MLDYVVTLLVRNQFSTRHIQQIADFDSRALARVRVDTEFNNGFLWRGPIARRGTNQRHSTRVR